MIFTKKQAAGVWCPWGYRPVQVTVTDEKTGKEHTAMLAANRGPNGEPQCPCIADQCPMWEWADQASMGESRRGYCARKTKPGAIINTQPQGGMRVPDLTRRN